MAQVILNAEKTDVSCVFVPTGHFHNLSRDFSRLKSQVVLWLTFIQEMRGLSYFSFKNNLIGLVQDQFHPSHTTVLLSLQDTLGKNNGWFLPPTGDKESKALLTDLFINTSFAQRVKNHTLIPHHTWSLTKGQNPLWLFKSFWTTMI